MRGAGTAGDVRAVREVREVSEVKDVATAPSVWAQLFVSRVREPAFWAIQGAVLAITALHLVFEALDLFGDPPGVEAGLHKLPVILYVVPIVYAGLRYGFEGAALTGAWCIVLTLPNIVLWHTAGFRWVGELLYAAFVVGVGIVVAAPVKRERRQRQALATTGRRLTLLNEVASSLVSTVGLDRALPSMLARLRDVLGLDAAAVVSWDLAEGSETETWTSSSPRGRERLRLALEPEELRAVRAPSRRPDGTVIVPFGGDGSGGGALVVVTGVLDEADEDVLLAVGSEIGVALDNARLHRQERDRLRSYVQEVTRVQEEERKRLARELHDTAAQDLVLLGRGLDALAEHPGTLARRLEELRTRAGDTLESLRRLSRDLRPTVLDDLGLVPALEWLAADLTQRSGVRAGFGVTGTARRLPAEAELALFRITQEALRNVERHAEASRVEVRAEFSEGSVGIEICDDGRGFDVPDPLVGLAQSGRLGLLGIHERAALVRGSLAIHSGPGEGTCVRVELAAPR